MQKAPKHLNVDAKRLWAKLQREYVIEDQGGLLLLQTAAEAFQRMRECQQRIESDGHVLTDRFGQPKAHPLLCVERDCRSQMLQALRHLNLDVEPLKGRVGKPAKGY